jgi:hypothetical protein
VVRAALTLGALALFASPGSAAPTDILLSKATVNETAPYGSVVGVLSTVDPNGGTHRYSLSYTPPDSYCFTISPASTYTTTAELQLTCQLRYEDQGSYTIHVVSDDGDASFGKDFVITVVNVARDDRYFAVNETTLPIGPPGVLANDKDPGGHRLTAHLAAGGNGGANWGTVTMNDDGSFTYDAALDGSFATDTFAYYACLVQRGDVAPACSRSIVTVNIGSVIPEDRTTGFFEDFERGLTDVFVPTPAGAWKVVALATPNDFHGGFVYRMRALGAQQVFTSRTPDAYTDFRFAADVRLAGGPAVSAARGVGLIFRAGPTYRNCYVFHVNAQGFYTIFKRVNGVTRAVGGLPVAWRPNSVIQRGSGAWNHLQVDAFGSSLTFLINGTVVQTLRDATFPSGAVGVKAFGDGATADQFQFDNAALIIPVD